MKNYIVKTIKNFNDMQEKTEMGTDTPRKVGDVFNCTKDRYLYLKEHNAVELVGIEKAEEKKENKTTKKTTKKKKASEK